MKHLWALCIGTVLFPFTLSSQDWLPFIPGEMAHYRVEGADYITHSIRVDSIDVIGVDTYYYFNRIMDTLDGNPPAVIRRGQFLEEYAVFRPNGDLLLETYASILFIRTLTLKPYAQQGESWLYDIDNQVMATVTDKGEANILGFTDSVKVITCSDGTEWRLTKHHGVLRYTPANGKAIELSGLEKAGIGDRLNRLGDYFHFAAGDVLEYSCYRNTIADGVQERSKMRILQAWNYLDSAIYLVDRFFRYTYSYPETKVVLGRDTILWRHRMPGSYPFFRCYQKQDYATILSFRTPVSFNRDTFWVGNTSQYSCSVLEEDKLLDAEFFYCAWPENEWLFTKNLGLVKSRVKAIDLTAICNLSGAYIDGDTIYGTLSEDWVFTSVAQPQGWYSTSLKVAPNPVSGNWVQVILPNAFDSGVLEMYSSEGRLLRQIPVTSAAEPLPVDVASWLPGLYTVRLVSSDRIWVGRMIRS